MWNLSLILLCVLYLFRHKLHLKNKCRMVERESVTITVNKCCIGGWRPVLRCVIVTYCDKTRRERSGIIEEVRFYLHDIVICVFLAQNQYCIFKYHDDCQYQLSSTPQPYVKIYVTLDTDTVACLISHLLCLFKFCSTVVLSVFATWWNISSLG